MTVTPLEGASATPTGTDTKAGAPHGLMLADFIGRRLDEHRRERKARQRWTIAVRVTSLTFILVYLYLLIVVRVMEPFYLTINLLSIVTGACGFLVLRAYELPTILAEIPRLKPADREVNLAAIASIRAALLGDVLPAIGLARTREEAAEMSDDELVRRLSELRRPDWRGIAKTGLASWVLVVLTASAGIVLYRPEHGVSLLERFAGQRPPIERSWSPLRR